MTVHDTIYHRFPELFEPSQLEEGKARRAACIDAADIVICDLVVVGGGAWTPEEESRMGELGIVASVHHLAAADDDTLIALYNRALAFVYPSRYEGFGIPLLEAMACGCPVVASRIPSTEEVAAGGAMSCPHLCSPLFFPRSRAASPMPPRARRHQPRSLGGGRP